jgi:hypothetical protein
MARIFVKPRDGMVVRDPRSMIPLKPEGEWKDSHVQWDRYARFGDVTITADGVEPAPAPIVSHDTAVKTTPTLPVPPGPAVSVPTPVASSPAPDKKGSH